MPDSVVPLHMAPHLPAELTDRVVDFLHDDWRALVSCVLTSNSGNCPSPLAPCAKYHLSHTIDLQISGSHTELLDFLNTFSPRSPLTALVCLIHIRGPPVGDGEAPRATFPSLIDLKHFPHLRALTLSNLFVGAPMRFVRFLCRTPALEDLSCVGLVPKPPTPGGYHLAPDVGPGETEAAAFCRRLKVLRIVDFGRLGDGLTPSDVLFDLLHHARGIWNGATPHTVAICVDSLSHRRRWLDALCRYNASLQDIEVTLCQTTGLAETSASGNVTWDTASYEFLESMPHLLSRRSLRLCYDPWRSPEADLTTSQTIDVFLDLLSKLLTDSESQHSAKEDASREGFYTEHRSFELGLRVPSDARADAETWAALFGSFNSGFYPELTRVRITLESLARPAVESWNSLTHVLQELSVDEHEREDAVKTYANVVRGALEEERVEQRTFEVVVRVKPSAESA
ncbi:hypothetical protein TRAPUB_3758 [Trametes pubescens]|uniref:Uncharacterized protein n=1 Tax=Trametes pubescens TaxID=154538 RepID=A0A1M2VCW4_TRAPU|nr:hypothetical protein TRAPUB_3758 [Trametes pubescens]